MFEAALREKDRFESSKGLLTVEDLWDLPLTHKSGADLETVALQLDAKLTGVGSKSFVRKVNPASEKLTRQLEIVKYIISVKQSEIDASEKSKVTATAKAKIMGILEKKQDSTLESMTVEELQAELAKLS